MSEWNAASPVRRVSGVSERANVTSDLVDYLYLDCLSFPFPQRQHIRDRVYSRRRTEATRVHGGGGSVAARGAGRLIIGLCGTHGSWSRQLGRFGGAVRSADRDKRFIDVPVSRTLEI